MLKRARTQRKMTQEALAEKVGVHPITITRIETGARRPSMALLQKLAKALGVKVGRLLE